MTNEELALSIQKGNTELLPVLWKQVQKLIASLSKKYYFKYMTLCNASGVTADDLLQEGYFALMDAVMAWSPESNYKLTAFLKYPIKNRFRAACGIRTNRKNPLDNAVSFETPIGEDNITLGDTIEDTINGYEDVEQSVYTQELHKDLDAAIEQLEPRQGQVIRCFYYGQNTINQTGEKLGIPPREAQNMRANAIRKLRHCRTLLKYRSDIIIQYGYNSSLTAFNNTWMSSTERAVEALEQAEVQYRYQLAGGI